MRKFIILFFITCCSTQNVTQNSLQSSTQNSSVNIIYILTLIFIGVTVLINILLICLILKRRKIFYNPIELNNIQLLRNELFFSNQ